MQDFFEHYFEHEGIHIKYSRSAPSMRGQEFHNYCEFVFFLGGNAKFISKNIHTKLTPGNIIFIPKNAYHQFVIKGNDYTRCIIGFHVLDNMDSILSSIGAEPVLIESLNETTTLILNGLLNIIRSKHTQSEKALYIYASVTHLLFEIQKESNGSINQSFNVSKNVHDALLMIDDLYRQPITVETLAKSLRISPSLLSHKFKKEMNISVYQYISKKRLATARQLIESGIPITVAGTQCGFSDYCCFLRAYKKQYGCVPSARHSIEPGGNTK
jgi:AraC-like DNA-binding protein